MSTLDVRLATLPIIGLADLDASAALLTRRDRKYVLPEDAAAHLVAVLAGRSRILGIAGRRSFGYRSVYFDTPTDDSYLGAARRRARRFKVRTRTYLDAGRSYLELKTRDPRGRTVKVRHEHPPEAPDRLLPSERATLRRHAFIGSHADGLGPALTTRYTRATLVVDAGVRITLDRDLVAEDGVGGVARLPGLVIVESKSPGPPSDVDRRLWSMGYRPLRISKFCTSLAALRADLPANRWTRALRQPWVVLPATVRPAVIELPRCGERWRGEAWAGGAMPRWQALATTMGA